MTQNARQSISMTSLRRLRYLFIYHCEIWLLITPCRESVFKSTLSFDLLSWLILKQSPVCPCPFMRVSLTVSSNWNAQVKASGPSPSASSIWPDNAFNSHPAWRGGCKGGETAWSASYVLAIVSLAFYAIQILLLWWDTGNWGFHAPSTMTSCCCKPRYFYTISAH